MATTQDLVSLKKKIERDAATYTKLYEKRDNGERLTEVEYETVGKIEKSLEALKTQSKTLAALPASTNVILTKANVLTEQRYVNVFSYTPIQDQNKNLGSNKRIYESRLPIDKLLYYKHNNVKSNMAVGVSTQSFGITDDLLNYTGQPTLKIQNLGNLFVSDTPLPLYSLAIENRYSVSFIFKLNRFPSKLHQKQNKFKQITSRRTDLLTFDYEGDSRIEFGAMAPFGKWKNPNTDGIVTKYVGNYNQFSIAANIIGPTGGSKSFYTDYKFQLGVEYHVKLEIIKLNSKNADPFGAQDEYTVLIYVNNVLESIAMTECKVWGQKGNFYKRNLEKMDKAKSRNKDFNFIASQPNFLPYYVTPWDGKKFEGTENAVRHDIQTTTQLNNFSFNSLISISTPPKTISNSGITNTKVVKIIGNNRLYKINNGVDVGTIDIFVGKVSDSKDMKSKNA